MSTNTLTQKTKELYKNTKDIFMFFEDQIVANLIWYRKGNLMFLNDSNSDFCVYYDEKVFKKLN